jgi:hypothetical protein
VNGTDDETFYRSMPCLTIFVRARSLSCALIILRARFGRRERYRAGILHLWAIREPSVRLAM